MAGDPEPRFQFEQDQHSNQRPKRESQSPGASPPSAGQRQEPASPEQRILASAVSTLASRQHSEEQLRRRLTAKFGAGPGIDRCINLLKDKGYLSDSRLAESYAAHRTGVKAMGRARL